MCEAAFSSKSVLRKTRPLCAMGDECGTSATSPRRRAPSSVSISFCSTSWPRVALPQQCGLLEAHLDALDHGSLVRERLGGRHSAFGAVLVRRGEDLFGGHVGDAVDAVAGGGAAAEPEMVVGQAEAEVGAGAAILQRGVALFIQEGGALLQARRRESSTRPPGRRRRCAWWRR